MTGSLWTFVDPSSAIGWLNPLRTRRFYVFGASPSVTRCYDPLESARDEGDVRNEQRKCPKDTAGHTVPPKESKFVFIASFSGPACSSVAPALLAV
ncbi:hypothetical protein NEOLEDRAFT_1135887 [Neolentinus lepideus HHB14362 ss-1]|uniref:Uncharacterized protein n=1 Tax=Neolentinus lepideus HHB14362 ss-1 TaxID=1314782 RepID=A0A165RGB6_9AGAM|nr:hypothetical protein NEOLEDRAFT_1135887 [Neolentinus lepideus HHB14362 ss-1]